VDEFQDTNGAQLELLRLLVGGPGEGEGGSVFVVGDDDQSIYAWRGAEMRNLLDFESHFPGAALIKLQRNYRSSGNIITASNAVIHRNSLRRPKEVFTARDAGEPLYHHVADDEKSEMDWLVAKLKELNHAERLDWKEMAVLVRTNIQLREYMEQFIVTGIPFMVKGANNLLERSEVQQVLAYAKLMANPQDELSLARVLAFPKRGWPKDLLDVMPRGEDLTALECLRRHCGTLGQAWTAGVLELIAKVEACAAAVVQGGFYAPLSDLLAYAQVVEAFEEGSPKRGRVEEFLRLFKREEERNPEARLAEVLNTLALDTSSDEDPEEKPGVRLMTAHASKGLEFHTVFLPSLDDDVFPAKPNHTDTGIEEERRLFYVAMTRARHRLFLSWPKTKIHYRVVRDVVPSRFVFEIPEDRFDGPLGKKSEERKAEFLNDFFASIRANFNEDMA
jgi:DNA helicase II / ATP-dependent DNA helicase PcrA